ncbi:MULTISPECIES: hypothetical protein [unclassified Desulfosporosinus]|uniref:hypothetical protein n=1 Tax=unclassified Desulfosporosinus TaxID=2633794 RepID=UPI000223AF5D|nr:MULTISPECIES: hypothetical protein [unclassified Desulfosporosinus]EGW38253.1 hypothetical protein DOT_3457 [Desulfosporosinus sp. OT]ODA41966.1 hypothetical protein DSBG_1236 [Desulfosporosinus sp. BG]
MSDIPDSDLDVLAKDMEKKAAEKSMSMVSFNDLFTSSFMTTHTKFSNFKELLDAGKYNVNSLADFMAILDAKFDVFINKTTKFQTWEKMQSAAVDEYLKKQPN